MTHRAIALILPALLAAPAIGGECSTLGFRGKPFDLSTGLTTQRRAPAAAYNSVDEEYMVVWFDLRNPGNNDVFGQRVSAGGAIVGSNIAIMEFAAAQIDPGIAHNPIDNEYLVGWRTQQAGFFNKTRGRRVAGDGTLVGNDFFIGEGHEITVSHNPVSNQFLQIGRGVGIRGQRVTNTGGLTGGIITVATAGAPAPNGGVARDVANDRWLATWRNQSDGNLQGQLIGGNGALVGGPILISELFPESGRAAGVAHDTANERYLVVFGIFQENRILGQFVGSGGKLEGDAFTIADGLSSRPSPTLAFSPASAIYAVAYIDAGVLRVRPVTADGVICDEISDDSDTFGIPTIVHNEHDDEFLIAWTDDRNLGEGEQDIYAQLLGFDDCSSDLDDSGAVDFGDILEILAAWGNPGGPEDLDGSGTVDFGDILVVLAEWGPCP